MAIIQISKIQQRSGNLVDLPQLDTAQFGFASDAKLLFIGAPASISSGNVPENVEVLTAYSNIAFSQVEGSGGSNLNVTTGNLENGQVLAYDNSTNSWYNAGGSTGGQIDLGDVSNLKISGGSSGYVLETDGLGNLGWTPKGAVIAFINNVTQTDPGVVTTVNDNPFTNGLAVTISDIQGMTELNGNTYYVKVVTANSFQLFSDSGLTANVDTTGYSAYVSNGRAVSSLTSGGGTGAAGSNTSVQYNASGILGGSGDLTFDYGSTKLFSVSGNVSANNYFGGNLLNGTSSLKIVSGGNAAISVAGNPNIFVVTNTGANIAGTLSISGNANIGNLGTATILATGISSTGNVQASGNLIVNGRANIIGDVGTSNVFATSISSTGNVQASGNLIVNGLANIIGNASVGNISGTTSTFTNGIFTNVSGNGFGLTSIPTANLSGQINLTSQVTGALPITNGGTGQTTSSAAINALLPTQASNSGKVLTTNGINVSWGNAIPTGMIVMWSGSVGTIPTGWALCDGTSGTPDLRGRFIIGAGGAYAVGAAGGASTVTLTNTQLPSHSHTISLNTSAAGAHTHTINDPGHSHTVTYYNDISLTGGNPQSTSDASISAFVNTGSSLTGISINAVGDHVHVVSGSTASTGTGSAFSILPPYYALCFIMKL